ncbi:MAG TPA: condensation domain-containing protein, partial [Thermoanaerobaculia bacterium]|nr:condensation domain-containing protein [Thermoanaerobaculia bacterium]
MSSAPLEVRDLLAWLAGQVARLSGFPASTSNAEQDLLSLGFDSLTAVELRHQVEARFGVGLSLARLLEGQTLREIAEEILTSSGAGESAAGPSSQEEDAEDAEVGGRFPLSHGQRALWFLERLTPENAAYNIAAAFRLRGDVDPGALSRALQRLAARHSMLRAAFCSEAGEPRQEILPEREIALLAVPAATLSERELAERLAEEASRPFDLSAEPLFRLALYRRSTAETVALLTVHHIIADLWSLALLERDLTVFYRAELGLPTEISSPPTWRYADYVSWQIRELTGEAGARLWR